MTKHCASIESAISWGNPFLATKLRILMACPIS